MSVLQTVWATIQAEFGDFAEVERITRATWRMGEALLLGAAIGWDRERRDAEAGLRTHMLVALGAALFVLIPMEAGMDPEQLSRVVQGLVSGIGFLGAGAVLKDQEEGRIHGLTTAASIWATAAIGLAAGMGRTGTAVLATVFILLVLVSLRRFGRTLRRRHGNEHRDEGGRDTDTNAGARSPRDSSGTGRP
ncbi:MgtC/SapB family protein [Hydrogenophaga sp. BPS33]|uniref:MgtC/SapB family protein n=1 Tax=Hydrogenophaga sp. BPS33 TaxID=2651974 RepID=UPI00131FC50E|nr:MgtC/SapB family protein [Hydrogenophaga sp. BPS33]QHE85406.1 MgtC/SapB family protein [Hydrogenophaga sp. BPS33]